MFLKKNRLRLTKEIKKVLKEGKKLKGKGFDIVYLYTEDSPEFKIGVLVGKKVAKKAVLRNKIRRILREAVRFNLENLKEKKGLKLLLIARSSNLSFRLAKTEIEKLFAELRN